MDDHEESTDRTRLRAPAGWTLVALVTALCFLAGSVGWAVAQDRPPSADSADVGFLRDMRSHHENAIALARIELVQGREPGIQVFAEEILRFQSYEIGLMDRLALDWGHRPEDRPSEAMGWMGHAVPVGEMPGVASPAEMDRARTAGADTDAVFVALMIDHHASGIEMAEAALDRAGDADVLELADRIVRTQRAEIAELRDAAARLGLDAEPEGVEPDVGMGTHADGEQHEG